MQGKDLLPGLMPLQPGNISPVGWSSSGWLRTPAGQSPSRERKVHRAGPGREIVKTAHSSSEIDNMGLMPALLCHQDTTEGNKSPY